MTLGVPTTGFCGAPGSRIEIIAVFVEIDHNDLLILFESVKHAIAMMRVDIDIGDPLRTCTA